MIPVRKRECVTGRVSVCDCMSVCVRECVAKRDAQYVSVSG